MTFEEIFSRIQQNKSLDPSISTSAHFLRLGTHEIGKKLVEEAAESWMAAEYESPEDAAKEIAQLIYWAAMLAVSINLDTSDIYKEL